ncbi:MAG: YceI family protein [Acidobacteriota bacterium]
MSDNNGRSALYKLDPGQSRFQVRAFAGGMFSALGHNPTLAIHGFGGEVRFVREALEASSLQMKIRPDSLSVVNDVSDKDRREMERAMQQEVLEIAKYPAISFESSRISGSASGGDRYQVDITGNLSLHGVTRSQLVRAYIGLNGERLHAYGEFTLRQTDFKIKLVSVAGGALKLKDELKFSFDIVAVRTDQ